MSLRDYQTTFIGDYDERVVAGDRHLLGVAPTGAGKTVIATEIVKQAVALRQRVLFLVHRLELIEQASEELHAAGIDHGIVAAGFPTRPGEPVQIAMVQTLDARAMRTQRMALPRADLVVVDEAHHATAKSWHRIITSYPDAIILGLTATPCRKSGGGLGDIFETLVQTPQIEALIAEKWLVGTRVYGPPDGPDLKGVRSQGGDYVESQLAERVDKPKLVGDVVVEYQRHGEGRRAITFATNLAHARHLCDAFNEAGIVAEYLDGKTDRDERRAMLARFEAGTTDVVVNCGVLTEGFDCPDVGCIILARPTRSFGLYRQMIGRGLRRADGKDYCIVIDHAGATTLHGRVEDAVDWTLDTTRRAESKVEAAKRGSFARRHMRNCPECDALDWSDVVPCRVCGWRPMPKPVPVEVVDQDLVLHQPGKLAPAHEATTAERRDFHAQLLGMRLERPAWSPKAPAAKYRERFGDWPPWSWSNDPPRPPTPEVRRWIQSRLIAWHRAQAATTSPGSSPWQGR